jgi:hypothetical protein
MSRPPRFRPVIRLCPLAAAAALSVATPAASQTVRGVLVEEGTGQPIRGAMVWLMDGERRIGAALSDSLGRFFIRAPRAGRYIARAERIGYEDATSGPIDLMTAAFADVRIAAPHRAIVLSALEVEGEQRCRVNPAAGLESAQLWREARKALTATEWTRDQALYRYVVVEHERELDPASLRIIREQRTSRSVVGREPIRSIPATRLDAEGYIHEDGDSFIYYAPDAQVLLSDTFLDAHCFRARVGTRDRAGLVGLEFEPIPGRRLPDIQGVLWLDGGTAELRFIEYRYTRLPYDLRSSEIGGRIDLERVPSGAWIVRRWYIRMPMVTLTRDRGFDRYSIRGIQEAGGEVTTITPRPGRQSG